MYMLAGIFAWMPASCCILYLHTGMFSPATWEGAWVSDTEWYTHGATQRAPGEMMTVAKSGFKNKNKLLPGELLFSADKK